MGQTPVKIALFLVDIWTPSVT